MLLLIEAHDDQLTEQPAMSNLVGLPLLGLAALKLEQCHLETHGAALEVLGHLFVQPDLLIELGYRHLAEGLGHGATSSAATRASTSVSFQMPRLMV